MNSVTNRPELDYSNGALLREATRARLRPNGQSRSVDLHSNGNEVMAVPARPATTREHGIAGDDNSSQLVNFSFAMTTFLALGSGLLAMCCGMVGASVWLTFVGFILTLVGGGMYGWSLSDT